MAADFLSTHSLRRRAAGKDKTISRVKWNLQFCSIMQSTYPPIFNFFYKLKDSQNFHFFHNGLISKEEYIYILISSFSLDNYDWISVPNTWGRHQEYLFCVVLDSGTIGHTQRGHNSYISHFRFYAIKNNKYSCKPVEPTKMNQVYRGGNLFFFNLTRTSNQQGYLVQSKKWCIETAPFHLFQLNKSNFDRERKINCRSILE